MHRILGVLFCVMMGTKIEAQSQPQSEKSQSQCLAAIKNAEETHKIPTHLLGAIGVVESGKKGENRFREPSPWVIQVNGKGLFFKSKEEAVKKAKQLQSQGIKNMDVGCLQVNLHHHPDAFGSLEEAFDPGVNTEYAAKFLADLRRKHRTWIMAVAHYHSMNKEHNIPYRKKVFRAWAEVKLMYRIKRREQNTMRA